MLATLKTKQALKHNIGISRLHEAARLQPCKQYDTHSKTNGQTDTPHGRKRHHTYKHTYIHTYIHTYMPSTDVWADRVHLSYQMTTISLTLTFSGLHLLCRWMRGNTKQARPNMQTKMISIARPTATPKLLFCSHQTFNRLHQSPYCTTGIASV